MSGKASYLAGLAAEQQITRLYQDRGLILDRQRWRGQGGEIDLIFQDDDGFVFVEVKKSRTHARAAERVTSRQISRLVNAATEFLAQTRAGLNALARFDVALIDAHGQVDILENAITA